MVWQVEKADPTYSKAYACFLQDFKQDYSRQATSSQILGKADNAITALRRKDL